MPFRSARASPRTPRCLRRRLKYTLAALAALLFAVWTVPRLALVSEPVRTFLLKRWLTRHPAWTFRYIGGGTVLTINRPLSERDIAALAWFPENPRFLDVYHNAELPAGAFRKIARLGGLSRHSFFGLHYQPLLPEEPLRALFDPRGLLYGVGLSIQDYKALTDDDLLALASSLRPGSFHVSGCPRLTEAGWLRVPPYLNRMGGGTLTLSRMTSVTDAVVAALADHLGGLSITAVTLDHTAVTDAGMAAMAASCRYLRSLYLNGTAVTDAGVAALLAEEAVARVDDLYLEGCAGITDATLRWLGERASRLRTLDVRDTAVTPEAVRALEAAAPEAAEARTPAHACRVRYSLPPEKEGGAKRDAETTVYLKRPSAKP